TGRSSGARGTKPITREHTRIRKCRRRSEWGRRPSGDARSVLVLAPLAPKRRGVDPENLGGFVRGLGVEQDAQDVLALALIEGEVAARRRAFGGAASGADSLGEGGRLDHLGRPQDGDALHDVAELAHVARPRILQESLRRRGREREERSLGFDGEELEKALGE